MNFLKSVYKLQISLERNGNNE